MAAITYNISIPLISQSFAQTQPLINQNFTGINTWTKEDHEQFSSSDAGKHTKVTLITQSPAPTFTGTERGIWNAVGSTSSEQEIFIKKTTNSAAVDIAMTESSISNAAGDDNGYTYLPSGLILQWTTLSISRPAGSAGNVLDSDHTFPVGAKTIAFPNKILSMQISKQTVTTKQTFVGVNHTFGGVNDFRVTSVEIGGNDDFTVVIFAIGY